MEVYPLENLYQTVKFLNEEIIIKPYKCDIEEVLKENSYYEVDFSEVKGQQHIKRALEIAASGGHNIFMLGSQYDM